MCNYLHFWCRTCSCCLVSVKLFRKTDCFVGTFLKILDGERRVKKDGFRWTRGDRKQSNLKDKYISSAQFSRNGSTTARFIETKYYRICLHALALCWLFARDHTLPVNHFMMLVFNDAASGTVSSSDNPLCKGPFYMRTCVTLELRGTYLIAAGIRQQLFWHFHINFYI